MTFARFLIRLFVTATGLFIVAYLCIAVFIPGVRYRFIHAVRVGIAAGALLTLSMAAGDYARRRTILRRYGLPVDYSPRQKRRISAHGHSAAVAVAQIEAQLPRLRWIHPQSIEREGYVLRAVTHPSWWSFAAEICVSVEEADPNFVDVSIGSRPRSRGTIVDYGRAIENVERLKREIEEWLR